MDEFCIIPEWELVQVTDLQIDKARELARVLITNPYTRLIEARRDPSGNEIIIFETEVELGQRMKYDIRPVERIAIVIDVHDKKIPEVLALRSTFPRVPHLNLGTREIPRSLCLYDQEYDEIKLRWNPVAFIERIRQWLALTAKGKLHAADQPLEPFFTSACNIILPNKSILSEDDSTSLLAIRGLDDNLRFLQCYTLSSESKQLPFIGYVFRTEPKEHGIINRQPSTLSELHNILNNANIDLISMLRSVFRTWYEQKPHPKVFDAKLILIGIMPQTRQEGGEVENYEPWAFLCFETVLDIGVDIGIWENLNGTPGLLLSTRTDKTGDNVRLLLAQPILPFSKEFATVLSGIKDDTNIRIVKIGVGALGSQILLNLVRIGYGKWTIVDKDSLFPHNLARHALHSAFVGGNKAIGLQEYVCSLLGNPDVIDAFPTDVMDSNLDERLQRLISEADIILDVSTSIAVARHLALDLASGGRRISMFMNPSGYDLVVLAEDKDRKITLDQIEMQYYRYLLHHQEIFREHLNGTNSIRYSRSCRDITSTIPQDVVALQASICSRALRRIANTQQASIEIWQTDPFTFSVKHTAVSVVNTIKKHIGEWTVCTDGWLLQRLIELRQGKLPNETGGVLVGSFDMQRKIVYIVDTIPSPSDSKEWPTVYIRGFQGLSNQMENINKLTNGGLEYVGEWHSHPDGYGCLPSVDDQKAFVSLKEHMAMEGKPVLMLIVGATNQIGWYLGQMG
jgi:hypothetical protein